MLLLQQVQNDQEVQREFKGRRKFNLYQQKYEVMILNKCERF